MQPDMVLLSGFRTEERKAKKQEIEIKNCFCRSRKKYRNGAEE